MYSVCKKLKSNNGATLMLALLFFIVCAVTGSMILLSATVATGGLDGMRERDQNFYAVRSAAKFVEERLKKESIEVTEEIDIILVEDDDSDAEEDDETEDEDEEKEKQYDYKEPKVERVYKSGGTEVRNEIDPDSALGNDILYTLLFNENVSNYNTKLRAVVEEDDELPNSPPKEFYDPWFIEGEKKETDEFEYMVKVFDGAEEKRDLKVKMTAKMDSRGNLTLTFKNDDSVDTRNKYEIKLKMKYEEKNVSSPSETSDKIERKYRLEYNSTSLEKVITTEE
ncbi:hypothetical protein [Oribacterium sp. WCC10]|uniref:hypothetical protein n=1 Tax=Oribacterium sp. WCC10 TaxID=1855343 RepID=UPI0008E95C20|nr:hypothetical protein [Oribacterium sp. WCC10]SFG29928.1 hypothetical protein SAMN05216356_10540 [Oribacterium sp. WCC10]